LPNDSAAALDFGKVLETDLANIVKKAAAGAPLSKRERDLIEAEKAKREKAAPAPTPKPAPVAPVPKKSGRASRTGFLENYQFYGDRYGASARTVKRWAAKGKEPGNPPCPLDQPEKLRGWWEACMSQRCPDGIISAEIEALKNGATPAAIPAPSESPEAAPAIAAAPVDLGTEEKGLAAAMERLEKMEVEFSKRATEPGQAKIWFDAIARMTSLAANVRKELEAQALLAPKVEVEQELCEFMQPIERGIRGMYETFCATLELPRSPALEGEWLKQCDQLFARFGKEVFSHV